MVVISLNQREKLSAIRLRLYLLEYLKRNKTVWGYMAISTKELCRRINRIKERSFCHNVNDDSTLTLTKSSFSVKRGCMFAKEVPCLYHVQEIYKQLKILKKKGFIVSYRGKGLDRQISRGFIRISRDVYRYWRYNS